MNENGTWSADRKWIAQTGGAGTTVLRVHSTNRSFLPKVVQKPDGDPYNVYHQDGSRWLDDTRLIFWDRDLKKAFLWDIEEEKATPIDGIDDEPAEFVFSRDGRTLFALQANSWAAFAAFNRQSDIWLLEIDPESIK